DPGDHTGEGRVATEDQEVDRVEVVLDDRGAGHVLREDVLADWGVVLAEVDAVRRRDRARSTRNLAGRVRSGGAGQELLVSLDHRAHFTCGRQEPVARTGDAFLVGLVRNGAEREARRAEAPAGPPRPRVGAPAVACRS